MSTVHAIFEKGVFRPTEPVELPDNCEVVFEPRLVTTVTDPQHHQRVMDILSRRYDAGITDLAERHNEHQP